MKEGVGLPRHQSGAVLGVVDTHNSAAAITVNGELIAAVQEERFTRQKVEEGLPVRSIAYCLRVAGLSSAEVQVVLSTADARIAQLYINRAGRFAMCDWIAEAREYWGPRLRDERPPSYMSLFDRDRFPRSVVLPDLDEDHVERLTPAEAYEVRRQSLASHLGIQAKSIAHVRHHKAHAYWAALASAPVESTRLIVTADGAGDGASASVSTHDGNTLGRILYVKHHPLALLYRLSTLALGFKPFQDEFKIMGLAPYGKSQCAAEMLNSLRALVTMRDGDFLRPSEPDIYASVRALMDGVRFDNAAAALQNFLEESLRSWLQKRVRRGFSRSIAFAGGLALNVKAVGSLAGEGWLDRLDVPFAPGDESLAPGMCFAFSHEKLSILPRPVAGPYLGPDLLEADVQRVVEKCHRRGFVVQEHVEPTRVASDVVNGLLVANARGRMEFGPRALGNRSILARADRLEIAERLNLAVKQRDFWMPFAPMVLAEDAATLFVGMDKTCAAFMTTALSTTSRGAEALRGAIHPADRTARPQVVSEGAHPWLFELLTAVKRLTGIGAVINTSLNVHGYAIACSADDCLETFTRSGLDCMVLGRFYIEKSEQARAGSSQLRG